MRDRAVSTTGKQDYATPQRIIKIISTRFPLWFDLAATKENARFGPQYCYTPEEDSLTKDWAQTGSFMPSKFMWLNPPFRGVTPWMAKCRDEAAKGAKIVSLTKASIGTKWYEEIVRPHALCLILRPRVKFEGAKDPFAQDVWINVWGLGLTGLGWWNTDIVSPEVTK